MANKYIQSFYQYPVTFSSIGKTVPSSMAQGEMKNIAEVTEAELLKLQNQEPLFRELVNKNKYRVLNKIPASYIPPAEQINKAHEEAEKLRAENEALKAKLSAGKKEDKPAKEEPGEEPVKEAPNKAAPKGKGKK